MEALYPVFNVLGRLLMFFALAYVPPIVVSFAFHDGHVPDFLLGMLITFGLGLVLAAATRSHFRELKLRDGFLLVTLSWTLMAAIATVPLLLSFPKLSFTDAFFEMMSALTTTGATVFVDLDQVPPSINLWRHELQWLGGMGIIVLAVAILPLLGVGGMQLYKAEMAGPMKDRLTERISDTAQALWIIYAGLTIACLLALHAAGMSWFDALCHAFSAVSLGGFSTRDAGIRAWDSPAIEAVLVVFMVLCGINFATHFTAWRIRSPLAYNNDREARAYLLVLAAACVAVAIVLHANGIFPDWVSTLRHAVFNTVSVATTAGYASVDYSVWPIFAPVLLLFLSSITTSSGSTGSGIKMVRALVLYKQARRELQKLLHPSVAHPLKLGAVVVPDKVAFSVLGFIFLYFMTAVTMIFLLLASGLDFLVSFSAIIACINNLGTGLYSLGPAGSFAPLSDFQKWVCIATMLLGRLEILSVVVIFTRHFWRK